MSCPITGHDRQRVKYVCIDKACHTKKKIGCADCFLESHATHKRMKLEDFQQQARTKACTLANMKFDVLREDDVSCREFEFDAIVSKCLIDRQKYRGKETWKDTVHKRLYRDNKESIEDSLSKINRMDQILKDGNFNQQKYQELAGIYFNSEFWATLAKNKLDQQVQIQQINKKKDKYFSKMYPPILQSIRTSVADNLLRDLNFDNQRNTSYDGIDYYEQTKPFPSPEQLKDATNKKMPRTRHFGSTAQKLFSVPATKKFKFNSP